jgi:hypothetical protein
LLKAAAEPLRDPASTDRTPKALMALGLADVDPVIAALHDKLGHVRTEAARALLARKNPAADALWILGLEAVDPLIAALDNQDANMRKLAERALKIIGEPRGLEAIARRTSETDTR